jgi:hypothetical protein
MTLQFDRVNKAVSVSQKKFINDLIEEYKVTKKARSPAADDLYDDDPDSPLLADQRKFMSLNASCAFAASRTWPELLPCTSTLSTRNFKATENDYRKAYRQLEYMNWAKDDHELYLRPKSLNVVGYADASYAERSTGHSQTGGCLGFEGHTDPCLFIFCSSKQPVVAKSSCEAELIAANTVGDYYVWVHECLDALELRGDSAGVMYQDNKSTIQISEKGRGSFKRTKHIRVRFFWISELIKFGELVLSYLPTGEMIADILTKPLMGSTFRYLRRKLLGISNKPDAAATGGV